MVALPAHWARALGAVCTLVALTAACSTPAPIPDNELSVRLARNNLVLMPDGDGPFPAVLLLHTCFGNLGHVDEWARRLRARGYVTVVVNSMRARDLEGHFDNLAVCTGRVMPSDDRARDIAISIERLRGSGSVDPLRIGIIGFSHGGWTLLDFLGGRPVTASAAIASDARTGVRSAVTVYPYCGGGVQAGLERWPRDIQVLILLAESDGTVGTATCEKLAREQQARGYAVSMHMYPGAKHGFDIDPALLDGYDERYDEPGALDARRRITRFLDQTLKDPAGQTTRAVPIKLPRPTPEGSANVQHSHRRLW